MCPVKVFDADAADQSAVKDSAVSAVKSTVTAAGVAAPADPIAAIPGAFVALPVDPTASSQHIASPCTNTVPVEPFERVCISTCTFHGAAVTPDPQVKAPD